MKKTLVAAACAAALGMGSVANAANVEIYGAIDTYIAVNNDSGNVSTALSSGGSTGSYFGFKGEENLDIWGGTKVLFKLESGFLSDNGTYAQSYAGNTDRFFHREAWVGFENAGFGHISFGRQYTPHFLAWAMTDSNGLSLGTSTSAWFYPGAGSTMGGGDPTQDDLVRRNNSIFWVSPSYNGFSLMAFASLGETSKEDGTQSNTDGNVYNIALQYAKGPLFLMASVLHQNLSYTATDYTSMNGRHAGTGKNWYYELTGSYDLGFTKPSFQIEYKDGDEDAGEQKFFIIQLGTSTPMFGGRLNTTASYYHNRTIDDDDGWAVGARFDYNLSKRTMVYAGISLLFQDDNSGFSIEAGPDSSEHFTCSAPGNDQQQIFFGIRHFF